MQMWYNYTIKLKGTVMNIMGLSEQRLSLPVGVSVEGGNYVIDNSLQNVRDIRGHLADGKGELQGKLPWHPTFSKESPYSTPATPGGDWIKGSKGKWAYTPSQWQVRQGYTKGLSEYFKRVEPDAVLKAPVPYSRTVFN